MKKAAKETLSKKFFKANIHKNENHICSLKYELLMETHSFDKELSC